jgi:radical SAM superfamily enzyme YgiQ (UPF0313 family)
LIELYFISMGSEEFAAVLNGVAGRFTEMGLDKEEACNQRVGNALIERRGRGRLQEPWAGKSDPGSSLAPFGTGFAFIHGGRTNLGEVDRLNAHMNALLVYPRFPVTYWGFQYGLPIVGKQASLPPLGLLTVAALLPDTWRVRLVDLNVGRLEDKDLRWADVVLTGGLLVQVKSMQNILSRARAFQRPVAVGGPAPTTSPELFGGANVVFQGEAEGRIDELVQALARPPEGRVVLEAPAGFPDMGAVPVPRFDLLDLSKYVSMSVQYSRGCPFQCEFCDVIEIFGRKPRVKTPEQVIDEFEAIHRLGYRGTLFVVDDNFIGNKSAARGLLPQLQNWQRARGMPFELCTEASVNLAQDPGLLNAMVDAGFSAVFLGIETPSVKALKEANKHQNLRGSLSGAIDRITAAGIEVMAGFIVGFDSDGPDIFAAQREFIGNQPVPIAMVGMLTALPGTAMWRRLKTEGRLRRSCTGDQFSCPNFTPVMDERMLLRGYADLLKRLYSPKAYYRRCEAFLRRAGTISEIRSSNLSEVGALVRAIWYVGFVSPRRRLFWRLLARAVVRGAGRIRSAVTHAIQGEHLIRYTRELVIPRLERALAEIKTGMEHGPRTIQPSRGESLAEKALGSLRAGDKTSFPVERLDRAGPLSTLTRGNDG